MRKDIKPREAFVPSEAPQTVWQAIGINNDRFTERVKPSVDKVFAAGGKIADAFAMIANNGDLSEIEKMYCIFEISKVCAYRDVKNQIKTKGMAAGVPRYQIDQMFGGYENLG